MADSALKARIQEDMKSAMRAKEMDRLGTIRLLLSAMKQKEVDERIVLSDSDILSIINKMIKQRRESIAQFQQGNRTDLAQKEEQEIAVLSAYMPAQLSDAEVDAMIAEAITSTGAASIKDMGKVMGIVKAKAQGQVDMAKVGEKIKAKLA